MYDGIAANPVAHHVGSAYLTGRRADYNGCAELPKTHGGIWVCYATPVNFDAKPHVNNRKFKNYEDFSQDFEDTFAQARVAAATRTDVSLAPKLKSTQK